MCNRAKTIVFSSARNLFFAGGTLLLFVGFQAGASIGVSWQMQLGNPSTASADTNNHDHYLIQRAVEAIDYNDRLGEPNWVSWDLTVSDIGSSGRSSSFYTDTNLPPNFNRVKYSDYTYSGYDRGHMCPSEDRTDNTNDNKAVFFMSNIVPQTPDNNQGVWGNLENYCQALAQAGNELLIICGPSSFDGARINTNGPVYIPGYTWKIAVIVQPGSGSALSRINYGTRVIAVNVPNIAGIRSVPWTNYLTSVNQIQMNTGFIFFTALPAHVAAVLRAKVDGMPMENITSFSPIGGSANAQVTIIGTNFTAASAVEFNGMNAAFTVNSSNKITAFVPVGATTGAISVIAPGGFATSSNSFTVMPVTPPTLTFALTNSNALVISWPSDSTGFVLQSNSLLGTTHWIDVTNVPVLVNNQNQVIFSTATGNNFFRLFHP